MTRIQHLFKYSVLFSILTVYFACNDTQTPYADPNPQTKTEGGNESQLPPVGDANPPPTLGASPTPWPSPTGPGDDNQTAPTSNGSGGGTGYNELSYQAGSYRIDVPQDAGANKAYGLHIHLHGDGGAGYRDFPNRAPAHDLIGVTARSPRGSNDRWGRTQGVEHARFLDDLIQNELLRKWNIRTDRIFFSGVSGGAYFLTGHFIPMYHQKYRSGALILCGGMPPQVNFDNAAALAEFRTHMIVTSGERRDIRASIAQSLTAYRTLYQQAGNAGNLSDEVFGSAGHCEFDDRSYTSGIQLAIDQKFGSVISR